MDMRIGTWNVRSLYRSGSLKTVQRELGKYKLHLVSVQEIYETRTALNGQRSIHSPMDQGQLWTGSLYIRKSTVRRVESVSDRLSYIVLRGHWCNIIVLMCMPHVRISAMM
jgi:hypothetical protein